MSTGLKLELEPTLGNHYQELIENWYMKLNEFSLIVIGDIKYCDKTLRKMNNEIASTEEALKDAMEQEEYKRFPNAIRTNAEVTKRKFKQKKFKKFNTLNNKPQ